MATGWRRRGTGPYDSRPGLRAKTRRSGPACYRKGSLPAAGWRKKNTGEALLTQNRKHYRLQRISQSLEAFRVMMILPLRRFSSDLPNLYPLAPLQLGGFFPVAASVFQIQSVFVPTHEPVFIQRLFCSKHFAYLAHWSDPCHYRGDHRGRRIYDDNY